MHDVEEVAWQKYAEANMHDVEEVAWQKYAEITVVSAEKLRIEQELRRWRPRGFRGTRGLRGMTSRKYRALEGCRAAVR